MNKAAPISEKFKAAKLFTRVITAVVALLALLGVTFLGGAQGLSYLVVLVMALAAWEYVPLGISRFHESRAFTLWYFFSSALAFSVVMLAQMGTWPLMLALAVFISGVICLSRGRDISNENLLSMIGLGALGILYCVVFPSHIIHLLRSSSGLTWFYYVLATVFAGDIFAYFGGLTLGQKKLLMNISPKKTIAGSLSGLLGSTLLSALFAVVWPELGDLFSLLILGLVVGFFAQAGDLFVSLIKRAAQVKDTGFILPGHGGVLDRVDGVLIACPIVFAYSQISAPL